MLAHLRARNPVLFGVTVLFIGIFAGEYWHLYDQIPHLDKVLHLSGGLAVAWFAMAYLQDDIVRMRWPKQLLVIVAVTALVGVLWELAEFWSNFTQYSYPLWYQYFHGGGLADTMGDLIADIVGGTVFVLGALYKEQ